MSVNAPKSTQRNETGNEFSLLRKPNYTSRDYHVSDCHTDFFSKQNNQNCNKKNENDSINNGYKNNKVAEINLKICRQATFLLNNFHLIKDKEKKNESFKNNIKNTRKNNILENEEIINTLNEDNKNKTFCKKNNIFNLIKPPINNIIKEKHSESPKKNIYVNVRGNKHNKNYHRSVYAYDNKNEKDYEYGGKEKLPEYFCSESGKEEIEAKEETGEEETEIETETETEKETETETETEEEEEFIKNLLYEELLSEEKTENNSFTYSIKEENRCCNKSSSNLLHKSNCRTHFEEYEDEWEEWYTDRHDNNYPSKKHKQLKNNQKSIETNRLLHMDIDETRNGMLIDSAKRKIEMEHNRNSYNEENSKKKEIATIKKKDKEYEMMKKEKEEIKKDKEKLIKDRKKIQEEEREKTTKEFESKIKEIVVKYEEEKEKNKQLLENFYTKYINIRNILDKYEKEKKILKEENKKLKEITVVPNIENSVINEYKEKLETYINMSQNKETKIRNLEENLKKIKKRLEEIEQQNFNLHEEKQNWSKTNTKLKSEIMHLKKQLEHAKNSKQKIKEILIYNEMKINYYISILDLIDERILGNSEQKEKDKKVEKINLTVIQNMNKKIIIKSILNKIKDINAKIEKHNKATVTKNDSSILIKTEIIPSFGNEINNNTQDIIPNYEKKEKEKEKSNLSDFLSDEEYHNPSIILNENSMKSEKIEESESVGAFFSTSTDVNHTILKNNTQKETEKLQ